MNIYEIEEENSLPMDKDSRMQRAKQLGFTIRAYHGTGAKFNEFDLEKGRGSVLTGHAPIFQQKKKKQPDTPTKEKNKG